MVSAIELLQTLHEAPSKLNVEIESTNLSIFKLFFVMSYPMVIGVGVLNEFGSQVADFEGVLPLRCIAVT